MDVSKDPAPTSKQGHEELQQRILQLDGELQVKEASLQDQARRIQVSADLIVKMRTELRTQSARLIVRCYQRSRSNDPDAGHFGSNGSKRLIRRASRSPQILRRFHSMH